MFQLLSHLKNKESIFIGDYDSYTIIKKKYTVDDLLLVTKIALLLFDNVLLPAAFFWQSKEMQKLMLHTANVIQEGIIVPVIRDYDSTTDIRDYFERRLDEGHATGNLSVFKYPEIASEIARESNIKQVKTLESINSYAYSDISSVRETFKNLWLNDLSNYTDINSLRLLLRQSNISDIEFERMLRILRNEVQHPQFSRSSCIERIETNISSGNIRDQINRRVSWLYLKSNALAYNSKLYCTDDPYNGMVFEENLMLLLQTLSVIGITKNFLSQLSIKDILLIKQSPEYTGFIAAYRELINSAYCRQNDVVNALRKKIEWSIRKESIHLWTYKKLSNVQSKSTGIFMGLLINLLSGSNVLTSALAVSGALSILPAVLKRFGLISQQYQSASFYNFREMLATQFQNRLSEDMER